MVGWLKNSLRGGCMGIADAIPGVSGGTIALILGIYERFIAAVSAVGPGMLRALFTRELWRRLRKGLLRPGAQGRDEVGVYAEHILFLGSLVFGIAVALVIFAGIIPGLLANYPSEMNGFFFGLVLASLVIPYRLLSRHGARELTAFVAAAALTFWFVGVPLDQSQKSTGTVTVSLAAPAEQPITLTPTREATVFMTDRHGGTDKKREVAFLPTKRVTIAAGTDRIDVPVIARLAGRVANLEAGQLRASIGLPEGATISQAAPMAGGDDPALWFVFVAGVIAISAMVLPGISGSFILLMLGMYNYVFFNIRAFVYDQDGSAFAILAVFGAALVLGILSFARLINLLLKHFRDPTLAALVGIMVGSLRKLWPWTEVDGNGTVGNAMPPTFDASVAVTVAMFAVGIVVVLGLDRIGRKLRTMS